MNPYVTRLGIALFASIGIHLVALEVWWFMGTLNVLTGRVPAKVEPPKTQLPVLTLIEPRKENKPRTFVETDSSQISKAAPKDSKYYSAHNTQAANPKPDPNNASDRPKLDGKQDKVPSSANVTLPHPAPSEDQPVEEKPKPKPAPEKVVAPVPEQKPAPKASEQSVSPEKKELAMVTTEPTPKPEPVKPPKPKTEATEARIIPPKVERQVPQTEMKSDSGVSRQGIKAFDVTGTKFGSYDQKVYAAIGTRWIALTEEYTIPGERGGHVTIRCHLNDDGTVTELSIAENTAGDILALYCQKAITDSAPFGRWPEELRSLVPRNYREMNITFYYMQ